MQEKFNLTGLCIGESTSTSTSTGNNDNNNNNDDDDGGSGSVSDEVYKATLRLPRASLQKFS